jgi:hypothetical protein
MLLQVLDRDAMPNLFALVGLHGAWCPQNCPANPFVALLHSMPVAVGSTGLRHSL